jgi:hypothetical protein
MTAGTAQMAGMEVEMECRSYKSLTFPKPSSVRVDLASHNNRRVERNPGPVVVAGARYLETAAHDARHLRRSRAGCRDELRSRTSTSYLCRSIVFALSAFLLATAVFCPDTFRHSSCHLPGRSILISRRLQRQADGRG